MRAHEATSWSLKAYGVPGVAAGPRLRALERRAPRGLLRAGELLAHQAAEALRELGHEAREHAFRDAVHQLR